MKQFFCNPIGKIMNNEKEVYIKIDEQYCDGLKELDGFSHIQVLWWFNECDTLEHRKRLEMHSPYKGSPAKMGTFATRAETRPNPIALTTVQIVDIDYENGVLYIPYIDAKDNTPIIDIKPYTPSLDRIENPRVPKWCENWPKSVEESGNFDWGSVFNF